MLHLPTVHLGTLELAPLALAPLLPLVLLAFKPSRTAAIFALLTVAPLLAAAPGPGLVGGVVVGALLLRGLTEPGALSSCARLALPWLAVALLQPSVPVDPWPYGVFHGVAALVAVVAIAATLQTATRWPIALVLVLLPFAPFGDTLLRPAHLSLALPFPQVAARWQFEGQGEIDAASLSGLWFLADRLTRGLAFAALLLGWIADRRGQPAFQRMALALLFVGAGLLVGQTYAAANASAHAPGFAGLATVGAWDAAGVGLGLARLLTLGVLLVRPLTGATRQLDLWVGLLASIALAGLALGAPDFWGPTWFADPLALGLAALILTALVRSQYTQGYAHQAAGAVQVAVAAGLVGGAWAGWATASGF